VGRNKNQSFEKRKREQQRQERAAQKRAKRRVRAATESDGVAGDPDFEEVVVGPQEQTKATDEEVERAIERAMNPGAAHTGGKRSKQFGKRLFVGNLDRATEEHEVRSFFRDGGFDVVEATLMLDRTTGESRGFAFIELNDGDQAKKAMADLGGTALHGRELRINLAD
jgi:RNA recognition motif-containing protein